MSQEKHRYAVLTNWSKQLVLPGFKGMSLHAVAVFFIKGLEEGALTTRASSIAFNFFVAFFPAIILSLIHI